MGAGKLLLYEGPPAHRLRSATGGMVWLLEMRRSGQGTRARVATIALLAVLLGSFAAAGAGGGAESQPGLTDLHRIDDLRALFNRDWGHPRLILLISPT